MRQQSFAFPIPKSSISVAQVEDPAGYSGLYGFHKYWGKKPHEPIGYVIEQLSEPGQLVLDPFVGSGVSARESVIRGRRFLGFDINPIAVELSRLLVEPPSYSAVRSALRTLEEKVKAPINSSYLLEDRRIASHYLWESTELKEVWLKGTRGSRREELRPTDFDIELSKSFEGYQIQHARRPRFFSNGRINASSDMSWDNLMTGRAQRNLDLLLAAISEAPPSVQPSLRLCLTAASGQMTKMVFAVTGRGKTTGQRATKVEVGSWVIGYWRPRLHFEVNAWSCFEHRCSKLLKAIKNLPHPEDWTMTNTVNRVLAGHSTACVSLGDCQEQLLRLPAESVDLIITDPPHSDRVPYLELSELWNSILNVPVDFDQEIVMSNAKERGKSQTQFVNSMQSTFTSAARVLRREGFLVVLFNSRNQDEWAAIRSDRRSVLRFVGRFPCVYSANSVVQDNREGAMKTDHVLVFRRADAQTERFDDDSLSSIPGWTSDPPQFLQGDV